MWAYLIKRSWNLLNLYWLWHKDISYKPTTYPDNKVHVANMGPTWVLLTSGGPQVGPMNLAIRVYTSRGSQLLKIACIIDTKILQAFKTIWLIADCFAFKEFLRHQVVDISIISMVVSEFIKKIENIIIQWSCFMIRVLASKEVVVVFISRNTNNIIKFIHVTLQ